jgi:hypothetical protein
MMAGTIYTFEMFPARNSQERASASQHKKSRAGWRGSYCCGCGGKVSATRPW